MIRHWFLFLAGVSERKSRENTKQKEAPKHYCHLSNNQSVRELTLQNHSSIDLGKMVSRDYLGSNSLLVPGCITNWRHGKDSQYLNACKNPSVPRSTEKSNTSSPDNTQILPLSIHGSIESSTSGGALNFRGFAASAQHLCLISLGDS